MNSVVSAASLLSATAISEATTTIAPDKEDAELLALGEQFADLWRKYNVAWDQIDSEESQERCFDITDAMDPIARTIYSLPAYTPKGLATKAMATRFACDHYWRVCDKARDWDVRHVTRLVEAVEAFGELVPPPMRRVDDYVAPTAAVDPIFAAIDAHRHAWAEANRVEDDDEMDRLFDVEVAVLAELLDVVPTSSAGIAALSRYAAELERRHYRQLFVDPGANGGGVEWSYFVHRNIARALT